MCATDSNSTTDDLNEDSNIARISEFYTGKNVFLTGGTGFIGKALIEKLLRSCPKIGTIYCLMRSKRGKKLAQRLDIILEDPLFNRLKQEQPDLVLEKKIVPLAGDMKELGLGLSIDDRKLVVDNVHIMFHSAASVRFDDPLADAIILNVRGTREVCQLALETRQLRALIHVSTAFANCDRPEAREILYPAKVNWREAIETAEKFDKFTLDVVAQRYLENMPNTYCFTKNVAEHVVNDTCFDKIPARIIRPSIVIGSLREEPVTGWIDNFNGPFGILVAYGKGIMRTSYATKEHKPDYIPVDILTKTLIVSAWDLALNTEPFNNNTNTIEVIQCTSHNVEWIRISNKELAKITLPLCNEIPFNDVIWPPTNSTTDNRVVWWLNTIFYMILPAILLDSVLKICGQKPMLLKIQKKIYIAQLALRHFMTNEWIYPNDNLLLLQKRIKSEDITDWDYEFMNEDLNQYLRNCCMGLRRYLLKEPDHTIPKAKRHLTRMYCLQYFVYLTFSFLIMMTLYKYGIFHQITNIFQR